MPGPTKPAPSGTARDFVRHHARLRQVPFVPELQLHTVTELTPLWHASSEWLAERDVGIPFWAVPWAGGQALARFVLDHSAWVRGRRVVDVGSGSGLCAIAAARAGADLVVAIDVDPIARAACELNAAANGVLVSARVVEPDAPLPEADVFLAGDVWYEQPMALALGRVLGNAARAGAIVLTGDPGRAYAPDGLELASYVVPTLVDLESATERRTRVLQLGEARAIADRSPRPPDAF